MNYEVYEDLKIDNTLHVFDFESTGVHGIIHKRIAFEPTELPNVYNLSFGDVKDNGKIDYFSRSNNGDRNKILATLLMAIELFTEKYPRNWVYFQGSTPERTRLYRIVVGINLEYLSGKYDIYAAVGPKEEKFSPFHRNMKVSAFLIKRNLRNFKA